MKLHGLSQPIMFEKLSECNKKFVYLYLCFVVHFLDWFLCNFHWKTIIYMSILSASVACFGAFNLHFIAGMFYQCFNLQFLCIWQNMISFLSRFHIISKKHFSIVIEIVWFYPIIPFLIEMCNVCYYIEMQKNNTTVGSFYYY